MENAAAARRVAAEGQDVFDAQAAGLGDDFADLLPGRVDAGEMEDGGEPVFALDAVHDHQGLFAGAPAGPVGDGAKIRLEQHERGDGFFQERAVTLVGFGRKKLEGNDRAPGGAAFGVDVADKLHWRTPCQKAG